MNRQEIVNLNEIFDVMMTLEVIVLKAGVFRNEIAERTLDKFHQLLEENNLMDEYKKRMMETFMEIVKK